MMKVIFNPLPGQPYVELNNFIKGTRLNVIDPFLYLGSILSRDGFLDSEINLRIINVSKPSEISNAMCSLTEISPSKPSLMSMKHAFYLSFYTPLILGPH